VIKKTESKEDPKTRSADESAFLLLKGEARKALAFLPDCSVHSVVTDPPYGLSKSTDVELLVESWLYGKNYTSSQDGYAGACWDNAVPGPELWREVGRVLMPGGFVLAFAAARTAHLTALALQLAGFEIRDQIHWVYRPGRPTSADIGKRAERLRGRRATLRPSHEPIIVARKPLLDEHTVVEHQDRFGTGAIDHTAIVPEGAIATNYMSVHDIECSPTQCHCALHGHSGQELATHIYPSDIVEQRSLSVPKPGAAERPIGSDGTRHETVKPLALMEKLVQAVTGPGQVVLDPFLGSGTTAEAAIRSGRHAVGCEMTPKYWELIEQRVERTRVAGFSVRIGAPFDLQTTSVTTPPEPELSFESSRTEANQVIQQSTIERKPMITPKCPRCGQTSNDAFSQCSLTDNTTKICSECGMQEVLENTFGTLTSQNAWYSDSEVSR
jgi:DNA modification methylase